MCAYFVNDGRKSALNVKRCLRVQYVLRTRRPIKVFRLSLPFLFACHLLAKSVFFIRLKRAEKIYGERFRLIFSNKSVHAKETNVYKTYWPIRKFVAFFDRFK